MWSQLKTKGRPFFDTANVLTKPVLTFSGLVGSAISVCGSAIGLCRLICLKLLRHQRERPAIPSVRPVIGA